MLNIFIHQIPISLARPNPTIKASYLALLFVAQNPHLIDCSILSPFNEVRTNPSLLPLKLLNPSTWNSQVPYPFGFSLSVIHSLFAYGRNSGEKFAIKSTNTRDFIDVQGWKLIWWLLSSTIYLVSHSESSGLCRIFFNGKVFKTVMG